MSLAFNYSTGVVYQQFSKNTFSGVLAATVPQSFTIPTVQTMGRSSSSVVAVITCPVTEQVYVSNNSTAVIPAGTIASASGEMIPAEGYLVKEVKIGDVLSLITSGTSVPVTIALYQSL